MANKTYCDICNNEIRIAVEIYYLKIIPRRLSNEGRIDNYPEVCKACNDKISNFIDGLKEEREKDE